MILDSIENCEIYYSLNRSFEFVFEYIKNVDLRTLEYGKHELTEDVFVISEISGIFASSIWPRKII